MPPRRKEQTAAAASKQSKDTVSVIIPSAIYLGPCSSASSTSFLTTHSINHVLSIGITPSPKVDGVTYHRLALNDSVTSSITSTMDSAINIINDALKSNKGRGRILIHCSAGASRSPTVVVGYLMKERGMSLKAALGHVVRARPQVSPNHGFLEQLKTLEQELYGVKTLEIDALPRREVDRLALFNDSADAVAAG
ncbi:hypothetical protein Ac2012v2_006745 [Leucoagaricus gongylophorus]